MSEEQPQGLFCQSCGMPIDLGELRGTEKDGSRSEKYCTYCYSDGAFLQPDATLEEMIEISARGWSDQDPTVTLEQAKSQMENILPQLERWRNP